MEVRSAFSVPSSKSGRKRPEASLSLAEFSRHIRQKEPSEVAHSDGPPTAKKPKISAFAFVGYNRITSEPS
jgi:hypothetical protein